MKNIAFDLDGTLCDRPDNLEHLGPNKYLYCTPNIEMINILNELSDKGHNIIIYTARGMGQFNGDVKRVYDELYLLTEKSLNDWGVKYHKIVMGKIDFDILIDDKAIGIEDLEKIRNFNKW